MPKPDLTEADGQLEGDALEGDADEAAALEFATDGTDKMVGRVLEASEASDGSRIFRCQMIAAGTSRNGVHYPEAVLATAARLYEGSKAFDHHRTVDEMRSSTIAGLVGAWRNVTHDGPALVGDLHLLPSAGHTAEALDASLAAQEAGLAPVVGISHDVAMRYRPAQQDGRTIKEAIAITAVLSTDVVADPSAGGRVTRSVAGGTATDDTEPQKAKEATMTLKELLTLLREADAEVQAELLTEHAAILEDAGLTAEEVLALCASDDEPAAEADDEPAVKPELVGAAAEGYARESVIGAMLVREAVTAAGFDAAKFIPIVVDDLGARYTEADVTASVERVRRTAEAFEKENLIPETPHIKSGVDAVDKKRDRLALTLAGDFQEGYHSIHQAFVDVTGRTGRDSDIGTDIIRESRIDAHREGERVSESLVTGSWGEVLGDVMNKRVVAEYNSSNLDAWRSLASVVPVADFRSQKLVRVGGFGVLPTVAEGGTYNPLTSPADEQATYSVSKKGGTEDFTYEMARNDDLKALIAIPTKLGRAAAQTLYRAVFDLLADNTAIYDAVALFHANHGSNTATSAGLSQTTLSAGRLVMRKQAAYGDTVDVLGLTPRTLIVPPELEEIAFQLANSAVAIPATPAGPSDAPNLHAGITPIVVDYLSDANDWFIAADPKDCPGIEVGFLDGKQAPETFVQDTPTAGASFSADTVTWKIRHIYGVAVQDYRGFYRGQG